MILATMFRRSIVTSTRRLANPLRQVHSIRALFHVAAVLEMPF